MPRLPRPYWRHEYLEMVYLPWRPGQTAQTQYATESAPLRHLGRLGALEVRFNSGANGAWDPPRNYRLLPVASAGAGACPLLPFPSAGAVTGTSTVLQILR